MCNISCFSLQKTKTLQNNARCTKLLAPSTEQEAFAVLFPSAPVETSECKLLESLSLGCKTRLHKRPGDNTEHICIC